MNAVIQTLKQRWYIVVIVLAIVGFFYFQQQTGKPKEEKLYQVSRETVPETLSLSGEVDAFDKASLQFQTSGKLAWVGVKEGDKVEKWQAIASLDQTETYKNLQKALKDYAKERNDFEEEFRVTYKQQTPQTALTDTIKRILEKNQWDLDKAVLDVELKDYSLKLSKLVSPISGIVTRVDAPVAGVNITSSTTLFQVVDPASIYFSANADQTEVVKLKEGTIGELILDSYPEETIPATVDSIAYLPKADETGTVYELKMSFTSSSDTFQYRLGMTGDVSFTTKEKVGVLTIPETAIESENGKHFVFKKENGKKIKIAVETGETFDSKIEVLSGLNEGDFIYD